MTQEGGKDHLSHYDADRYGFVKVLPLKVKSMGSTQWKH